jgi:hypothetical protein
VAIWAGGDTGQTRHFATYRGAGLDTPPRGFKQRVADKSSSTIAVGRIVIIGIMAEIVTYRQISFDTSRVPAGRPV